MEKVSDTIVGLGGSGHEWSATAICDNEIVSISEERLCRKKYGLGTDLLAAKSRKACLQALGKTMDDVAHVVACSLVPQSFYYAVKDKTTVINHHLAHAYCTFASSGFSEAAILIADNSGSIVKGDKYGEERLVETVSMYRADGQKIELLKRITGLHKLSVVKESDFYSAGETSNSIGHFYRTASLVLGFAFTDASTRGVFSEDGKTMGLAPFGDARFVDNIARLITLLDGGEIHISTEGLKEVLTRCYGSGTFEERASLAYAVQYHTERALLHCANYLQQETGMKNLCIAGGVGLNSVGNGLLQRKSGFDSVYVAAAPSDDGISLGCAYYGLHKFHGYSFSDLPPLASAYLGAYDTADLAGDALEAYTVVNESEAKSASTIASMLGAGYFVGVLRGRSEFGPRALGNRTILAPPAPSYIRDMLNHEIKHREWFRPYGVMVQEARVGEFFHQGGSSPNMSFVAQVKDPQRLAAATHVDGSARFQTVTEQSNPFVNRLLNEYEKIAGVAALINTSFNRAGEPIVETESQALSSAIAMNLDAVLLNEKLVCLSSRAKQHVAGS